MNSRVTNGQDGGDYIGDTSSHTAKGQRGAYGVLYPVADVVFTAVDGNVTGLVGPTFPAGIPIFGRFKDVTLASGALIAYNL